MATYEVITWRDIPAIVEARDDREAVSRPLSDRWQALIDSVAMHLGLADSEEYLAAWTRTAPAERPGAAADVAEAVVRELEDRFTEYAARAFRSS